MDAANTPENNYEHELAEGWLDESPLTVEEMDTLAAMEAEMNAIQSKFSGKVLDIAIREFTERREYELNALLAKVADAKAEQDAAADTLVYSAETHTAPKATELQKITEANAAFNEAANTMNNHIELQYNDVPSSYIDATIALEDEMMNEDFVTPFIDPEVYATEDADSLHTAA